MVTINIKCVKCLNVVYCSEKTHEFVQIGRITCPNCFVFLSNWLNEHIYQGQSSFTDFTFYDINEWCVKPC